MEECKINTTIRSFCEKVWILKAVSYNANSHVEGKFALRDMRMCSAVGSKIIRALEVIRDKILISNAVLLNKYLSNYVLKLYAVYNKYQMIKMNKHTKEKSQVLSQVLK